MNLKKKSCLSTQTYRQSISSWLAHKEGVICCPLPFAKRLRYVLPNFLNEMRKHVWAMKRFCAILPFKQVNIEHKKSVEPVCHSFHDLKAFALPGKSKRATLKAPRQCTKLYNPPFAPIWIRIQWEHIKTHPMRRSRCFVLDLPLSLRSS